MFTEIQRQSRACALKFPSAHTAAASKPSQKADFQAAHSVQNSTMVISPLAEKQPH